MSAANLHDSYNDFHHCCLLLSISAGASHHTQAQQVAESHLTKLQEQALTLYLLHVFLLQAYGF